MPPQVPPRASDPVAEVTERHGPTLVRALVRASAVLRMPRVELPDLPTARYYLADRAARFATGLTVGLSRALYDVYHHVTGIDGRLPSEDQLTTSRVQLRVQPHVESLVTGLSGEAFSTLTDVLERSFAAGFTPAQLARELSAHVGLSPLQSTRLEAYRQAQLAQGVEPRVVDQRVFDRGQRDQATRSALVAQTEITRATADASLLDWDLALETGEVGLNSRKAWSAPPDERSDAVCRALNGSAVPLGSPFQVEGWSGLGPPAHPNCRCALVLIPAPTVS